MKCLSCDTVLSDREATRRSIRTGDFIDLCDECFRDISSDIPTTEGDFDEGSEDGEGQ